MLLLYKNQEIFSNSCKDPFEAFFQETSIYDFKRKQVLFREGHPALGLYFVESGRVKVYKFGRNGRHYILFFAGPGEVLNPESVYGGDEFTTSGEMLEDGRIGFIEREKFNSLVRSNLSLSLYLSEVLTRRIAHSYEERVELAEGRVRGRMARALAHLAKFYGSLYEEGLCISLELSREELASMIGTTPGTVMRLLKDFKEEGAIRLLGRRIAVDRVEYLEEVAQIC